MFTFKSVKYFFVILIIFLSITFLAGCGTKINNLVEEATGLSALNKKLQADKDIAIAKAKTIFTQKVVEGVDLTNGPCLSNNLIPDWVFDIVHNPRQSVDNLPENQCQAYREGTAHHFVEMDQNGNLIEVQ